MRVALLASGVGREKAMEKLMAEDIESFPAEGSASGPMVSR